MDNPVAARISALVIIYNEVGQIRDCLETVKWADEIVVCDSFSTDGTVEICREFTDKIYQRRFDNFGVHQNWAATKPSCEWVLFVEADERFPKELCEEIRRRVGFEAEYDGYRIPFKHFFLGQQLKGKYWLGPKVKIFKNGKGSWERRAVHGHLLVDGKLGELKNALMHYPYRSVKIFAQKFQRYTGLEAEELIRTGKKVRWYDTFRAMIWVPLTFYNRYFAWGDYKSGFPGFLISLLSCPYPLVVNMKYWMMRIRRIAGQGMNLEGM